MWKSNIRHLPIGIPSGCDSCQGYQAAGLAEYIHQEKGIPYLVTEHYSGFLRQAIPPVSHSFYRSAFNHCEGGHCVSPDYEMRSTVTDASIRVIPNYTIRMYFPGPDRPSSAIFSGYHR